MADDIRLVIGVDDRDLIRTQKEQKKFERNLLIIESAFRKGDITAKRYNGELAKQAKQLSRLGGSYNKANSEVRRYAASLRKATDDQIRMTQATNMAGKSTNRFGMYAQQVGYQVGDFFVQVQSGTSALVAFGQQGTQLAGLLPGVAGAVVGISLSIGTMLLRSFMDVNDASDTASAKLKTFEENLKSAKEEVQDLRNELILLSSGFASVSEMTLSEAVDKATDKLGDARRKLEEATAGAALIGQGAAGGIDLFSLFGASSADKVADAKELVAQSVLELESLREMQRQGKERERNASVVNQLAQARAILQEQENDRQKEAVKQSKARAKSIYDALLSHKKVNDAAEEQVRLQNQAIYLQQVELKYGADSNQYRAEKNKIERENLALKLEQAGVDDSHIQSLLLGNMALEAGLKLLEAQRDVTFSMFEGSDAAKRMRKYAGRGTPTGTGQPSTKSTGTSVVKETDLEKLRYQVALETELLGKTEARQKVIQAIGITVDDSFPKTAAGLEEQINKNLELMRVEQERQSLIDTVTSSMEDNLMAITEGTLSVKDAFKNMARDIIKELYRVLVVQRMVNAAKSFMGFADGGVFSGGRVEAYADGGVVGSPTLFPMAGGKTGLMGEAGPEAIMPLKRGANGKLGVQMEGGGGDNVVINQSFNFQANGDDSVKKIIAQAAPQIAQMTKNSMLNDRRRGGTTKAVFG